jgi:uncharacterized damage-inducible protein DinB
MPMTKPEVWLRGPLPDIPPLLQPVAHGLLQCREEITSALAGLTPVQLWARPNGAASVGYHARHAAGALDRLFTYARGELLSADQRSALEDEQSFDVAPDAASRLATNFGAAVERALGQLRLTDEGTLTERRGVGRAMLPSTVIGLLFHGAEHAQRHTGQLVTTAKIVRGIGA